MSSRLYILSLPCGYRDNDAPQRKAVRYLMKRQKRIHADRASWAQSQTLGWAVPNTRQMRRVLIKTRISFSDYIGIGVDSSQVPGRRNHLRKIRSQLCSAFGLEPRTPGSKNLVRKK